MRFQTKLLLTYSLLVSFLVVVFGVVFYSYSAGVFERNAASNYGLLAAKIGRQLDDLIRPMDFISANLISGGPFKTALETLASLDRDDPLNGVAVNEAQQTIRSALVTYSIQKNFHGVVFFNSSGDFYSSNFIEHTRTSATGSDIASIGWIEEARSQGGKAIVVSPYEDPWSEGRPARVFGYVRNMPGFGADELGFLEVQKSYDELETVFSVPEKRYVRVLAFRSGGELFYSSEALPAEVVDGYRGASRALPPEARFAYNPLTGEDELVVADVSSYSGVTVVLALNRRILLSPLSFARWTAVAAAMAMLVFALVFNWFSARQLTKTLRLMQKRMEETELANLPSRTVIDHPNDELAALDESFRNLTLRLDEAVRNELRSRTAWMQARLDSLQAQINPHFLYNILTVIAGKGFERGDEEIGSICDGIAAMLRYSTSTAERSATLEEEIEHVRTYLFLMKKRFEDRLLFSVEVDPAILGVRVPKIILQQIVENSLTHGFKKSRRTMRVGVVGSIVEGRWRIDLSDNGEGFGPGQLEGLNGKIAALAGDLAAGKNDSGMEIGGLGLLNTYARLHLFYRGDFEWSIGSSKTNGCLVSIGGPLMEKEA